MLRRSADTTRLIDRLEKKDLVTRIQSQEDRRQVEITISDKGVELLNQIASSITFSERLLSELKPYEIKVLNKMLEKIRMEWLLELSVEKNTQNLVPKVSLGMPCGKLCFHTIETQWIRNSSGYKFWLPTFSWNRVSGITFPTGTLGTRTNEDVRNERELAETRMDEMLEKDPMNLGIDIDFIINCLSITADCQKLL